MTTASKIIIKHFFRPEQKVVRQLPVFYPPLPHSMTQEQTFDTLPKERNDEKLDLNGYLISHPSNTFFVKLSGDPIAHLGLSPGDLLVVDQTLEVLDGCMIVGAIDETFFASFVKIKNKQIYLAGEQAYDPDRLITPDLKCAIWGVVSYVIHKPTMKPAANTPKKKTTTLPPTETITTPVTHET